jgi:hypothetical protein
MIDQDTITAVREAFSGAQPTTPTEQVMARGQVLRRRRRSVGGGAIAAIAAAATVTALLVGQPGTIRVAGGPPGPKIQLAAWTVTKKPHKIFKIEFRQLADLTGLNAALRADGARTVVSFGGTHPLDCQEWAGPTPKVIDEAPNSSGSTKGLILTLHLGAMPRRAMQWIQILRYGYLGVSNSEHNFPKGSFASIAVSFFNRTKACANTSWGPDGGR